MEPESPSPYPQGPATCPYPERTPSSPHYTTCSLQALISVHAVSLFLFKYTGMSSCGVQKIKVLSEFKINTDLFAR